MWLGDLFRLEREVLYLLNGMYLDGGLLCRLNGDIRIRAAQNTNRSLLLDPERGDGQAYRAVEIGGQSGEMSPAPRSDQRGLRGG